MSQSFKVDHLIAQLTSAVINPFARTILFDLILAVEEMCSSDNQTSATWKFQVEIKRSLSCHFDLKIN